MEYRWFACLSLKWRRRPIESWQIMVGRISATRTKSDLKVSAALNDATHPPGQQVSDEPMAALELTRDSFRGEWNYSAPMFRVAFKMGLNGMELTLLRNGRCQPRARRRTPNPCPFLPGPSKAFRGLSN